MENPANINWNYLSENPAAIHILSANPHKIDWDRLSSNENARELLIANQDKINWEILSQNTAIFDYDYQTLAKERTRQIEEELLQNTLHPRRIQAWLNAGLSIDDI